MEKQYPQVELDISIDDDEIEAAMLEVLSLPELEQVVQRTLHEAGVTQPVSLTLLVTDDAAIQDLNKRYRQQDKPTDVLSFPLLDKPLVNAPGDQLWATSEVDPEHEEFEHSIVTPSAVSRSPEGKKPLALSATKGKGKGPSPVFVTPSELPTHLGDIVISWPMVVRQAKEGGHSPAYELLYLLAHGVLHLVGYDDQTEAGYAAMVHLQEAVLKAVGRKEA